MATKKTKTIDLKLKSGKEIYFYVLKAPSLITFAFFYSYNRLTRQEIIERVVSLGIITKEEKDKCVVSDVKLCDIMQHLNPMSYITFLGITRPMLGAILGEVYENYDSQKHWDFMRGV